MRHYYLNLPKDNSRLAFDRNMSISTAIQKTAKDAFSPFEEYLKNAIETLKKKEDVKANWLKIGSENLAELKLEGRLFEIQTGKFRYKVLADEGFEPDFSEPLIYKENGEKKKLPISSEQYKDSVLELKEELVLENISSFTWAGDNLNLKLMQEDLQINGEIIQEDRYRKVVYSKDFKPRHDAEEFKGDKIVTFIKFDNLRYENGEKFEYCEHEGLSLSLNSESDYGKKIVSGKLKFRIDRPQKQDKDYYWIQLCEIDDEDQSEDFQIFSPLRYFFDDDIEIKDEKGNSYEVADGKESENKIVLRRNNRFCFPEGNELIVKVNTYQLEKQMEAISTLKNMPVGEQQNLIRLFNDREKIQWDSPENDKIENWEVLKDETRSGCEEQRSFVEKALNTPDFAILEGPPGSGKTTVILELICQIIKQGKRILLCGSTHVAIDNVLERLKNLSLLEKFNILPVRIGDEQRINGDVKEFQIDNLVTENDISEDFLLDAANLVCGTTIGILKNPKFRKRKGRLDDETYKYYSNTPILPEFDYLIIDESSKTTFQEFLVPALYAKKWILAGDVMQLSPFTDRGEIVSNISQVMPADLQQAIFYLQKLSQCWKGRNNKYNKFILPASKNIRNNVVDEFENRKTAGDEVLSHKMIVNISEQDIFKYSKLELCAYDLILIDNSSWEKYRNHLPETHAVLIKNQWLGSAHAFEHNVWQKKHTFYLKERNEEKDESFKITEYLNKYFYEKNWAEEVAWRIDREHQLRLANQKNIKNSYSRQIEDFLPKLPDNSDIATSNDLSKHLEAEEKINQIAAMAFPSILESLVYGIRGRKTKVESTISEGFREDDLKKRRETLAYQHRMHPEISKFPREKFYAKEDALKDLEYPRPIEEMRQWDYSRYSKHSIWIDVKGKTERNRNRDEVKQLQTELTHFLEYARNNQQPEGKKWSVACLTFYRGQETIIREMLRRISGREHAFSDFNIENGSINIKLHTVDKFQGHEADIVFLSMVQTNRDGFMDNPNRLNVAITRAKFQLVIIGDYDYFSQRSHSEDLKELAKNTQKHKETR
ncbi:AAA family ATPase [bacterium]|nr:AAA family ATPase [bacterium]